MKTHNLSLIISRPIKLRSQSSVITKNIITNALHQTYKNTKFSTFPYLTYKCSNSQDAIHKYNSGNCIALSFYLKEYLFRNYNISSYIIPCTVPVAYRVENTPEICHCALVVPLSKSSYLILDPAFNFITPIFCNLERNIERVSTCCNIYEETYIPVSYNIEKSGEEDELFTNTIYAQCRFTNDPEQHWKYFLIEVTNPDESIGRFFIENKPLPFLLYTELDINRNLVLLKYKIYIDEQGNIVFKQYPKKDIIFQGGFLELSSNPKIVKLLQNKLDPYFESYII